MYLSGDSISIKSKQVNLSTVHNTIDRWIDLKPIELTTCIFQLKLLISCEWHSYMHTYWIHGAILKLLACFNTHVKFIFRVELAHMFCGRLKMLKSKPLCASGNQVFPKECVTKAYLLRKYKANQSGLATYAGNTMTHMPCSHTVAKSLGQQEILDNSSCNHV